ncbi:MAG: glutamate 5-kinase, partial [Actinomycetota bacterium]|nr:glutamate 5-kinase [Actinomycetota bacterium]
QAVIAAAERPGVLLDAVEGVAGVGTIIRPHERRLSARKLWIAFAVASSGTVVVDDGARTALVDRRTSLLPAGVVAVEGSFEAEDAVEIAGLDGRVFAKGLVRHPATRVKDWAGRRSSALPPDMAHEVVHRDDLVVLP